MASPLTLLMPLNPGTTLQQVLGVLAANEAPLHQALHDIGTVHYARFLVLDRASPNLQPSFTTQSDQLVLAVITEYDGSFEHYIGDFVKQVGGPFNALLQLVVGGAQVTPVENNTQAFLEFIQQNDASKQPPNNGQLPPELAQALAASAQPSAGAGAAGAQPSAAAAPEDAAGNALYQAYPYTVQDILAAGIPTPAA